MNELNNFCVFILSHGRAEKVYTLKTLIDQGYTGDWFIVVDDLDGQIDAYKEKYGDHVYVFDKQKYIDELDTPCLSDDHRCVVYARNACFDIAKEKGYRYFLELDDDYNIFEFRYREKDKLKTKKIRNLDKMFYSMIEFLSDTGSKTIAFCQGGDFIGGARNKNFYAGLLRKAMNSFFCDSENPFKFYGRINEDVNTYTVLSQKGEKIFSFTKADITQFETQANSGGMADMYIDNGTYVKSFYSVIYSPSCVKIALMGDKHKRIHHRVNWNNCTPMILNEKWKK